MASKPRQPSFFLWTKGHRSQIEVTLNMTAESRNAMCRRENTTQSDTVLPLLFLSHPPSSLYGYSPGKFHVHYKAGFLYQGNGCAVVIITVVISAKLISDTLSTRDNGFLDKPLGILRLFTLAVVTSRALREAAFWKLKPGATAVLCLLEHKPLWCWLGSTPASPCNQCHYSSPPTNRGASGHSAPPFGTAHRSVTDFFVSPP